MFMGLKIQKKISHLLCHILMMSCLICFNYEICFRVGNCMVHQDFYDNNFQPPISSIFFPFLACVFSKCYFNVDICLGPQTVNVELYGRNFQPTKKCFQALNLGPFFIFIFMSYLIFIYYGE